MEVILLENIGNLGGLGDKVDVKAGYGRNFLIPHGKAVAATANNLAEFETRRACQYIRENSGNQPFFLNLNYSPPHPPVNDCPEKYLRMYDPAVSGKQNSPPHGK